MSPNCLKLREFRQFFGPPCQQTASVVISSGNDLGLGSKNDYDVGLSKAYSA